jgi:hypothetical protein
VDTQSNEILLWGLGRGFAGLDVVVSLDIKIFRVGYVRSPQMVETFGDEKSVLGQCFQGLLRVLKTEMQTSQIWPDFARFRSLPSASAASSRREPYVEPAAG